MLLIILCPMQIADRLRRTPSDRAGLRQIARRLFFAFAVEQRLGFEPPACGAGPAQPTAILTSLRLAPFILNASGDTHTRPLQIAEFKICAARSARPAPAHESP